MIKVLRKYCVVPLIICLAISVVLADITVGVITQKTISTSGGAPAGASGSPAVASNGGFLVFNSSATNLVSNDGNSSSDIFLQDLTSGLISRINLTSQGSEVSGGAIQPAISPVSPSGLYAIAFSSLASGLSSISDQFTNFDIFISVPTLNFIETVSFDTTGLRLGDGDSTAPSVTILQNPNRALVTYQSQASNLVSVENDNITDIYLATVQLSGDLASQNITDIATIQRITASSKGGVTDDDSQTPQISGDGRYIVFASRATNLIENGPTGGLLQIYRYAIDSGTTELISKNAAGFAADQNCTNPIVSYSGRFVSYLTTAENMVVGGVANETSVLLHDLVKNTIVRVNTNSSGITSDGSVRNAAISANGRFVTFADSGTNLVENDTNGTNDVFIKDLDSGAISRLSNGLNSTEPNGGSDSSSVSAVSYNGLSASVFFRSFATNLTDDNNASGAGDIFVNSATLPAPQLRKGTLIETPPDVTIKGKKSKIALQKFSFPSTSAAVVQRAGKKTVSYEVQINGTGKRKKNRFNLIAKRNNVTSPKLKPGIYTTRYRAVAKEGSKVVSKTKFSPRQTFQIG